MMTINSEAPTTLNHLDDRVIELVYQSAAKKIDYLMRPTFINHPQAQKVCDSISALLLIPQRDVPLNIMVSGAKGSGKNSIYRRLHGGLCASYISDTDLYIPLYDLRIPDELDERELLMNIVASLGVDGRHGKDVVWWRNYVTGIVKEMSVRAFIVNGTDNLANGSPAQVRDIMKALHFIALSNGVSLVLMVTPSIKNLIHSCGANNLSFSILELSDFSNDADFRRLLTSFERTLPFQRPSNLAGADMSNVIHALTGGNLGAIKELLIDSAAIALNQDADYLDINHIHANKLACQP